MSSSEVDELVARDGTEVVSARFTQVGMRLLRAPGAVAAWVPGGRARVFAGRPIGSERGCDAIRATLSAERRPVVTFGRELADDEPVSAWAYVVGVQPWWDPRRWDDRLAAHASLRAQVRRAAKKGVRIRDPSSAELAPGAPLRDALDDFVARWLRTRHLEPLGFVAAVVPFDRADLRRYVVAERGGRVVGLLVAAPVPARDAWVVEHLLRFPAAPNGTSEALVDFAMRALADSGATAVTLGLCPLAGPVHPVLRAVRWCSGGLYDFQGLFEWKARFHPERWERVAVEHPGQSAALGTLRALRAFAGRPLWLHAVRTALRGPPVLLRIVFALLVPWIAVLALAGGRWFPSEAVRWAWVAFDLALLPALWFLGTRIASRKAVLPLHGWLAATVTVDAVVTLVEAATWNVARLEGPLDAAVVAAACAAPAATAVILWSALRHRHGALDHPRPDPTK